MRRSADQVQNNAGHFLLSLLTSDSDLASPTEVPISLLDCELVIRRRGGVRIPEKEREGIIKFLRESWISKDQSGF